MTRLFFIDLQDLPIYTSTEQGRHYIGYTSSLILWLLLTIYSLDSNPTVTHFIIIVQNNVEKFDILYGEYPKNGG